MLIRNHLLCPYSDCIANKRSGDLRIQVLVNQLSGKREVRLKTSVSGERGKTDLPYKHTNEVYHGFCPYCNRPVEVVIDETHSTRYIHLRQARQTQFDHPRPKKLQLKQPRYNAWSNEKTKPMKAPDPEEFAEYVREYERKYKGLEQIYLKAIADFKKTEFCGSCDFDVDSILRSYLLNWGRMGRVLGYRGCSRIGKKIVEMKNELEKLRKASLSTIDLEQMSATLEGLYTELLNADWKSDKGRTKRVGPTATAKVLHLALPDLFMIWDRQIRNCYGFRDSGKEYIRFIANMQNWSKKLSTTIDALQEEYGKPRTKLLDEYNWKKCWG